MATDVSLLRTRTVSQELGDRLDLDASPEDLQDTILAQPTTSSVLQIDISGSNPDDAVTRARTLAAVYLGFREEQLLLQADAVIDGHRQRIDALQAQVDDLTQQYDLITARGEDSEQAADILALRAQLLSQITILENAIEDASLEVSAVVAASRVLDPPSLVPQSSLRRAVLALGSGVVGGLGIGLGLVVVYAVTTGRLRRRADVAAAIGHPVVFTAGTVTRRWRGPGPRQIADLQLLSDGMLTALPTRGKRPMRLGLISVDCPREAAMVVAGAALRLGERGSVVALDLTGTGVLEEEVGSLSAALRTDADQSVTVAGPGPDAVADVVLSLVPFEIGRGLAYVKSSTPKCVVLVKAGRSTPEGLRTVAQAARAAGVDVVFVMLVGADSSDDSFGALEPRAVVEKAPRAR
jgi:capsular polysaccharide biosynthesis protein